MTERDEKLAAAIDWYENADLGNEDFKTAVVRGFMEGAAWNARAKPAAVAVPDVLRDLLLECREFTNSMQSPQRLRDKIDEALVAYKENKP